MTTTCMLLLATLSPVVPDHGYFQITVVDQDTGRGVPLVELRTVNNLRYYTDSNGIVAFHEPGLMNQTVFFHVASHGYEFPKDGFGYRGRQLSVTAGGQAVLKIKRINVAQRLYRVTGAGIYRDSLLVGAAAPIRQPVLNGLVFGSDSVVNTIYQNRIYWFWGDTNRPSYPLGNFHVPGATSRLPSDGGLDPEQGVELEYFTADDGFAKPTAQMPGKGPTWIDAVVTVNDESGRQRLFAKYVKVEPPLKVYERGLVEFDDRAKQFQKCVQFADDAPLFPAGHPLKVTSGGMEYVYFATPHPMVRVPATPADLQDLGRYEAYTCFTQGSRAGQLELDRDEQGNLRFGWKTDTPPLTAQLQGALIREGRMKEEEGCFHLTDVETGKPVTPHGGSVNWNAYRKRWVMIVLQSFGTSFLGEIWYAEAATPLGPWVYARKVVTHDKYSFYNPKQHPMFDKQGGRIIFFEGTYTNMFSGNPDATPRYNYNQVMYKLDLTDPRLSLPLPIYQRTNADGQMMLTSRAEQDADPRGREAVFFAPDHPFPGSVAVVATTADGRLSLQVAEQPVARDASVAFYALPADRDEASELVSPLYEYRHSDGKRTRYLIDTAAHVDGYQRQDKPLCYVWRHPAASGKSTNEP